MSGTRAYHGSTRPRRIWDYASLGNGNDQHGAGWYFTSCRNTAIGYAANDSADPDPEWDGYLHDCRLLVDDEVWANIVPNQEDEWEFTYGDRFREIIRRAPRFEDNMSDWAESIGEALDMAHDAILNCSGPFDAIQQVWHDHYRGDEQAWAEAVVELFGWDCGIPPAFESGEQHYVVWNPDCIVVDEMHKYDDVK